MKERVTAILDSHSFNVLMAVFVTLLWSSSWVIIKFGLEEIPPITYAGLRYVLASLILMVMVFSSSNERKNIRKLSKKWWIKLMIYGLVFYTFTQGAQFIGIALLPAITVSMLLSFTPIVVLILGIIILKEIPRWIQVIFILVALTGALLYFYQLIEISFSVKTIIGLIVVSVGVLANAFSTIMGRDLNQSKQYSPVLITTISMFIGSIILLIVGLITEEFPRLSWISILYIIWLSVANTALAFTIWNRVMQKLQAIEITIINNTMLLQITILAVIFLDERLSTTEWIGLALVGVSAFFVQIFRRKKKMQVLEHKYQDVFVENNEEILEP